MPCSWPGRFYGFLQNTFGLIHVAALENDSIDAELNNCFDKIFKAMNADKPQDYGPEHDYDVAFVVETDACVC